MKRSGYQVVLHQAALAAGCELRLWSKVEAIDENAASITLANGEEIKGDLIVIADGEHDLSQPRETPTLTLARNEVTPPPTYHSRRRCFATPIPHGDLPSMGAHGGA